MQSVVSVGDLKPFGLRFNSAFVDNEQRDPPRVQKNRKQGNETAEKKQPTPRTGGRKTTNTTTAQASSDNTAPAARFNAPTTTAQECSDNTAPAYSDNTALSSVSGPFPAPASTARTSGSSLFPSPAISDNTPPAQRFHSHSSPIVPVCCLSFNSFTVHGFEVVESRNPSSHGPGPLQLSSLGVMF